MDDILTHRDDINRRERDQQRVTALQSKSMQHFVNHPPSAASSARGPPIPAHPGTGGLGGGGANANSNSAFQV